MIGYQSCKVNLSKITVNLMCRKIFKNIQDKVELNNLRNFFHPPKNAVCPFFDVYFNNNFGHFV